MQYRTHFFGFRTVSCGKSPVLSAVRPSKNQQRILEEHSKKEIIIKSKVIIGLQFQMLIPSFLTLKKYALLFLVQFSSNTTCRSASGIVKSSEEIFPFR